ncbi:MAG: hypothetical protein JNK38_02380 [Acidobacteria bacterium]|nr:hypothetical protein [Acidobacteriota bacterium]
MKTDKKNLNTHTLFRTGSAMLSVKLAFGCLVLAVMFAVSSTQARGIAEQSVANSTEVSTTEVPAENLPDKISELGGEDDQNPVAERPGKPDSHNSNGDDVMVRPPR